MAEKLIIAQSIEEAVSLKDSSSIFLAGGTEVNRLDSPCQAEVLVSIGRIGMDLIDETDAEIDCLKGKKKGRFIRVGAMCTFQELVDSFSVPDYLREACLFMSSRTKRNMATIGGNIASARDDSYLLSTLIACGAAVELNCKGKKHVYGVCRYLKEKKNYPDSLITAVLLPKKEMTVASKRYANTAASHAVMTVSVSYSEGKYRVGAAVKNAGVRRLVEVEDLINAGPVSDEEISKAVKLDLTDDMFGSAKYKRYLLGVTVTDLMKKVGGKK
ncbi:MAG: FAD binding domain-containing protein [Sphaerochaetaceae bacterium]|nr:FAD binding domain-containing protein [Sphaerochaetaceae bacterium]